MSTKHAKVNLGTYTTEDQILDAIEGSKKITRLIIAAVQKGSKFEVSQILEHYGLPMTSRLHFRVANVLMGQWFSLMGVDNEQKIWKILTDNSLAMNKLRQNISKGTMALSDILTEWELPIGQLQSKIIRRIIQHFNNNKNSNNQNKSSNQTITTAWKHKRINEWTCNELQSWINSLGLSNRNKQKLIVTISEQEISGADFNSMEELSDVMDSFEIDRNVANKIYAPLLKIRTLKLDNDTHQQQVKDTKSTNRENMLKDEVKKQETENRVSIVTTWGNNDLLNWIKTIGLESKWLEIMIEIIKSTKCTGKDWCDVKSFKEFAKAFNIKQPMLANRVFRELKKAKNKQVVKVNKTDENEVKQKNKAKPSKQETKAVNIVNSKHIDNWTFNELKTWIFSLNLDASNKKKVMQVISEQEITGEDLNSLERVGDFIDSFDIGKDCATKIFSALVKIRTIAKVGDNS